MQISMQKDNAKSFWQGSDSFLRDQIILQSKCAIRPGIAFDFSKEHILQSVDDILNRLRTDYLDILLLHRPDTLMEPERSSRYIPYFKSRRQSTSLRCQQSDPDADRIIE